jgi:SepF-like predicted cell division protein (DUF552 family)
VYEGNRGMMQVQSQSACGLKATVYVKAVALHYLSGVEKIKREVKNGNILIVKITPLAKKILKRLRRL